MENSIKHKYESPTIQFKDSNVLKKIQKKKFSKKKEFKIHKNHNCFFTLKEWIFKWNDLWFLEFIR